MDADQAEEIAVSALTFLAQDLTRLGPFLALTGLGPADLREHAQSPQFLAGVLDHLLRDEALLLIFSADHDVAPELIAPAHAVLEAETQRRPR
jgi:hypothetical protein